MLYPTIWLYSTVFCGLCISVTLRNFPMNANSVVLRSSSGVFDRDNPVFDGKHNKFRFIFEIELVHHIRAVCFHGAYADNEFIRNIGVLVIVGDVFQHLAFTRLRAVFADDRVGPPMPCWAFG